MVKLPVSSWLMANSRVYHHEGWNGPWFHLAKQGLREGESRKSQRGVQMNLGHVLDGHQSCLARPAEAFGSWPELFPPLIQVNIRKKENCKLLTTGLCPWSRISDQKHPGLDGTAGRIPQGGRQGPPARAIWLFCDLLQAVYVLGGMQSWAISNTGFFGSLILLSTIMLPSWLDMRWCSFLL